MSHDDDDLVISLNMDHLFNKAMLEFMDKAPPELVDAFFNRMLRRSEFENAMEQIGGLTKYRRKMVVRGLVRMFRAGYRAGRCSILGNQSEATDGR